AAARAQQQVLRGARQGLGRSLGRAQLAPAKQVSGPQPLPQRARREARIGEDPLGLSLTSKSPSDTNAERQRQLSLGRLSWLGRTDRAEALEPDQPLEALRGAPRSEARAGFERD